MDPLFLLGPCNRGQAKNYLFRTAWFFSIIRLDVMLSEVETPMHRSFDVAQDDIGD
jgi:hypothetical protein